MFPSTVWKFRVPPEKLDTLNQRMLNKIMELKSHPKARFSENKWYSPRNLHEYEEFSELCSLILHSASNALEQLCVINFESIQITGCWANISSPGATHHRHSHPNNYFSGVYYLQSGEGSNTITFHDPRPQVGLIRPAVHKNTIDTAETANLIVEPGDIVFFPHWLCHSVEENKSSDDRISIAFNIMFKDYVEKMSVPMW